MANAAAIVLDHILVSLRGPCNAIVLPGSPSLYSAHGGATFRPFVFPIRPSRPVIREVYTMKRWLTGLLVLMSPSAFAQSTSAPELQFDAVPNFFKLPPDMHFGEGSGVAVNSKGNVLVYSRGGTPGPAFGNTASQILEFDREGNFTR